MAVTSAPFTPTDLQYTIPELWPGIMLEDTFPKAVFTAHFDDLSGLMEQGGDIVNIPDLYTNDFTVQTQSTEGAEVTTTSPAQANVQLVVDTHKYIAFVLGDKTARQISKNYNLFEAYAVKAKGQLMEEIEGAIAALWSDFTTNAIGDTATALSDAEIRTAIAALESQNAPIDEVALFVHPNVYWKQLAGITKYYDNSIAEARLIRDGGLFQKDAMRAYKGFIYDIPVFTSTKIVSGLQTYRNFMAHRMAVVWATLPMGGEVYSDGSGTPLRIRSQATYEHRNLGTLVTCDMVYGVKTVREEFAVLLNANTSALTS